MYHVNNENDDDCYDNYEHAQHYDYNNVKDDDEALKNEGL